MRATGVSVSAARSKIYACAAKIRRCAGRFLLALPKLSGPAFYAVEVRDPELLTHGYLAALCAGGATHCVAIHARMAQAAEQARFWRDAGRLPLVIRWSLHSGLKYQDAKERYAPFNALVDADLEGRAQIAALALEATRAHKRRLSSPITRRKALRQKRFVSLPS